MASLVWGAATDAGRVREANEDAFVAEPMVFVVADGMGGHQAGEVASALAATTLKDRLAVGAPSVDVVVASVVEANAAIFQTAHTNAAQRGMGTTVTALAVVPATDKRAEHLALVNVGDSRAYLRRNGLLIRATIDHSYVQELLATGHITEIEARFHPRRNIVTRALGIEPNVRVDSWVLPIVKGDRFILCSDGLVDEVDDSDIMRILGEHAEPQSAADALVAAAVENGGRDNVTVVVIDVIDGLDPAELDDTQPQGDITDGLQRNSIMSDPDPEPSQLPTPLPPPVGPVAHQLNRKITAKTFLLLLLGAVILTVGITLLAVAFTGTGTDTPAPTTPTSTTSTSSSTTSTTTSTTSTTIATSPSTSP